MTNTGTITSAQYFRTLATLHTALLVGQIAFAAVAITLRLTGSLNFDTGAQLNTILPLVAVAFAILVGGGGSIIFRRKRDELRQMNGLSRKLTGYRGAHILRWAMLEGPALFSVVAFLLTGNYSVLSILLWALWTFASTRPSPQRAVTDLQPTPEEEAMLLDGNAVVV